MDDTSEAPYFEVLTPLGFTVRTSAQYWQKLVAKHPDIELLEELVQQALKLPDEIRRSAQDEKVFLFYLIRKEKRWGNHSFPPY